MPITVSDGGEWIERLAIADLIYRYSDSVTRADWDQTEAVFAPDAVWESPALGMRFEGARTFRDFLAETTGNDLLIQTAHPPVIRSHLWPSDEDLTRAATQSFLRPKNPESRSLRSPFEVSGLQSPGQRPKTPRCRSRA